MVSTEQAEQHGEESEQRNCFKTSRSAFDAICVACEAISTGQVKSHFDYHDCVGSGDDDCRAKRQCSGAPRARGVLSK